MNKIIRWVNDYEKGCLVLKHKDGRVLKVLIDEEDIEKARKFHWGAYPHSRSGQYYVWTVRKGVGGLLSLHRLVLGLSHGDARITDHINHNTLDNRKVNLRAVDARINGCNRLDNTTGFPGVYFHGERSSHRKRYEAKIRVKGRLKYLGVFHDKDDAINRVAREGMKVCGKLSPYCFAHPQVTK